MADFGLSRKIAEASNSTKFGAIPYMDPKCLNDQNYKLNKKSDIYSIGVLMWQITSGRQPFQNTNYDVKLSLEILNGLREKPVAGTLFEFRVLYQGK